MIFYKLTSPVPNPQTLTPPTPTITFNPEARSVLVREVKDISVKEVSLYFLGGDPIPYIGLVPIDPRSSLHF